MATTQMPIEGVFNRETGQLVGISDEMKEIPVATYDAQGRLLGADGGVVLDVGAAQAVANAGVYIEKASKVLQSGGVADNSAALSSISGCIYMDAGTYRVSSSVTIEADIIGSGGLISVDSGVTVTINGMVSCGLMQLFTGSGNVVFGRKNHRVFPNWFGATPFTSTFDSLSAINKACESCATNGLELYFQGNYFISDEWIIPHAISVNCAANSFLKPTTGATGKGVRIPNGNKYGILNLPSIDGFSGDGLRFLGSDLAVVNVHTISNCGNAVVFETLNASAANALDNVVNFQIIGGCTNGIVFRADNSANIMQGNEAVGNFLTATLNAIVFETNSATGGGPNWDSNSVQLNAYDAASIANSKFLTNGNTYAVTRQNISVRSWFGGLLASGSVINGRFNDLDLYINAAQPILHNHVTGFIGVNNKVSMRDLSGTTEPGIEVATVANSRATFNGGAVLTRSRANLKITLASALANGATITVYVYHAFTDRNTNNFVFSESYEGSKQGLICDRAFDNSAVNANEIILVLRNVSGASLASGTVCYFALNQIVV